MLNIGLLKVTSLRNLMKIRANIICRRKIIIAKEVKMESLI